MRCPGGKIQLVTMQLDGNQIFSAGLQIGRMRGGLALRAALPCARDQSHGAVGRHVRETHKPIRERRVCGNLQLRARPSEDRCFVFNRRRIVNEAVRIDRPLIRRKIAPPEPSLAAN